MKHLLITLLSLTISFNALALKPSFNLLSSIAPDTYVVSELCPEDFVCVANGTVIDLQYTYSCGASLVSLEYDAVEVGNELHVFVHAIIKYSENTLVCQAFTHTQKKITLINQYGTVVLHNLGVQSPIAY